MNKNFTLGYQGLQGFNPQTSGLQHFIRTWNVAGTLAQPLINFGRIEADIETADAHLKRAYLEYQEIVLEALENMKDALTIYTRPSALLDVLVVQRNALDAESAEAESSYKLRKDLVNIYNHSHTLN